MILLKIIFNKKNIIILVFIIRDNILLYLLETINRNKLIFTYYHIFFLNLDIFQLQFLNFYLFLYSLLF